MQISDSQIEIYQNLVTEGSVKLFEQYENEDLLRYLVFVRINSDETTTEKFTFNERNFETLKENLNALLQIENIKELRVLLNNPKGY